MQGNLLISQHGRIGGLIAYGSCYSAFGVLPMMTRIVPWIILIASGFCVSANIDRYEGLIERGPRSEPEWAKDVNPEDYMVDQIARVLDERSEAPFSFQFPPSQANSRFAVNPSDPRYYENPVKTSLYKTDGDSTVEEAQDPSTFSTTGSESDTSDDEFTKETKKVDAQQDFVPSGARIATHAHIDQYKPIKVPRNDVSDVYFTALVAGCSAAAVIGVVAAGMCWYKLQKNAKAAADVEYPAYGVTGPNKDASPTGDRRLAQSAQMYHYQHQKQQIIAMESRVTNERQGSASEVDSEDENEEGDYTVYECPGLAPTGEMEVKNPLFQDDPTPATPANNNKDHHQEQGSGEK